MSEDTGRIQNWITYRLRYGYASREVIPGMDLEAIRYLVKAAKMEWLKDYPKEEKYQSSDPTFAVVTMPEEEDPNA